jgi:membrane protease subunit (stomatin/prohibitin family)
MAPTLSRDDDDQDALISWWSGDDLEPGSTLTCGPNESALFFNGDELVGVFGPGRAMLSPESQPKLAPLFEDAEEAAIAFVTTSPTPLDIEAELDQVRDSATALIITPEVTLSAKVRITDPNKLPDLLGELGDDESLEDWLGDELLTHLSEAIAAKPMPFLDLSSGAYAMDFQEATKNAANQTLAQYGVEVASVDDLEIAADAVGQQQLEAAAASALKK